MPTDYKYWCNLVKDNVKSLADEAYQRHEWFVNTAKTWYFPTEMFCQFFDDAAIEAFLDAKENGLDSAQIASGKHLVHLMHQLSHKYPNPDNDAAKLIDDPVMIKCRSAAKEFLALL